MKKLYQNLSVKVKREFWLSSLVNSLLFLVLLFLPTQLGKHFWPSFSSVSGLRIDYLSPTLYFSDILILLLLISSFKSLKKIKLNLITLVFLIFLSMGIILSSTPLAGLYGVLKIGEFSFFGFYIAKNIKKIDQIAFPISIGLTFESLLAVWQFLNVGSLGGVFYFLGERAFNSATPGIANASVGGSLLLRPYGTFSHPNVLAGYLLLSMTILFFSKTNKYSKVALILLGSTSLVLTLGRVALLVWIAVLIYFFIKKSGKALLALLSLVLLFYFLTPLHLRFESLSLVDEAAMDRVVLSKAAIEMFFSRLLLGVGLNNFLVVLPYYEKNMGNIFYIQPVHNIFLLILAQLGILGAFPIFLFFFKTYKRVFAHKRTFSFLLIFQIFFLGFFDHYFLTSQQGQMMLALVLGLCWSDTIKE